MNKFIWIISLFLTASFSHTVVAADIDPGDYKALSDKEMGHIRYLVDVALQPPGDWDHMGTIAQDQQGDEAYRYQLAFSSYTLAIAQHQKTPAYRELYAQVIDTLIQKMLRREVWSYWFEKSRIKDSFDYTQGEVTPWRDPVKNKNIMYSGHLLQMVGVYSILYNDPKYDAPGSLGMSYVRFSEPEELQDHFSYDHNSLAKVVYDQYTDGEFRGLECEPNLIFSSCNQFTIAGLLYYDQSHGTTYGKEVAAQWTKTQEEKGYLHPERKEFMLLVKADDGQVIYFPDGAAMDSATPAFQHMWNTDLIKALYPAHRDTYVPILTSGFLAGLTPDMSALFGAFALYAAELGDRKSKAALLAYAEENYKPKWENGWYYYPRNDIAPYVEGFAEPKKLPGVTEHAMQRLANIFLSQARINDGGGLWALHNEPWDETFFAQPYISGVDYPRALVTQAIYDADKQALIVGLKPGTESAGTVSIDVNQLDPQKHYVIKVDDRLQGKLDNGALTVLEGALRWSTAAKTLSLDVTLDGPKSIVIYAVDDI